jgi:hypothetical protein
MMQQQQQMQQSQQQQHRRKLQQKHSWKPQQWCEVVMECVVVFFSSACLAAESVVLFATDGHYVSHWTVQ